MPLRTPYGVIKGRAFAHSLLSELDDRKWPHYHVSIALPNDRFVGCAVNLKSRPHAEIESRDFRRLDPGQFDALLRLPVGAHQLSPDPTSGALDYVRHPAFQDSAAAGEQGTGWVLATGMNLVQLIEYYFENVYTLYVFGALYPTLAGVHDVHMNQGDPLPDCPRPPETQRLVAQSAGSLFDDLEAALQERVRAASADDRDSCADQWHHYDDSGVWQDGGLLFEYRTAGGALERLSGLLIKFKVQSLHIDGAGHPAPTTG